MVNNNDRAYLSIWRKWYIWSLRQICRGLLENYRLVGFQNIIVTARTFFRIVGTPVWPYSCCVVGNSSNELLNFPFNQRLVMEVRGEVESLACCHEIIPEVEQARPVLDCSGPWP